MRARFVGLLLLTATFVAAASTLPARAAAAPVPLVNCITPNTSGVGFWVYFGYANAGVQETILFGDSNQIVPGLGYQGQPETFNTGVYPKVFRAVFNSVAFQSISWDLAGSSAVATTASPRCVAGQTGAATAVSAGGATLSAQLEPDTGPISYHFDYGTTPAALDLTTPVRQVSATAMLPVTEPIAGLQPGTTYYFRLEATNALTTTVGELGSFTTAALPVASTPLDSSEPPAVAPVPPTTVVPVASTAGGTPALADLSVARSGPQRAVRVGRTTTLRYTVKNAGAAAAVGTVLSIRLAPGVAKLRVLGATCTGRTTLRCALDSLGASATKTVSIRVRVRARGRHTDAAAVVSAGADASTSNNVVDGVVRGRR
ncbi:MAG: DUF11 domain-containing protein [Solirubrobacteraceae bacterium]|nr:DUF11 domain-containing protein [Solirubrobacteraceae bacterium]